MGVLSLRGRLRCQRAGEAAEDRVALFHLVSPCRVTGHLGLGPFVVALGQPLVLPWGRGAGVAGTWLWRQGG